MKNIIKNYFYNAGYQILLIILPLVTTPYISRVLGAENMGTYSYANSITQYFILFGCIGLNLYGQREIAYYQNEEKEINRTFWELFLIRVVTLSISILLFYLTFVQSKQYGMIFAIQILDIIASIIDISWLFQGLEDFKRVVIRNFIIRIISVILVFVLVRNTTDLYLYVFIYSFLLFLGNISIWFCLPKYIRFKKIKKLRIKKHIKPVIMLFFPQIATSLYSLVDKTMLGIFSEDNSEVAFYEQAQTIVKALMVLITSLSTAMMPRVANLFKNNNMDLVKTYLKISLRFVYFLSFAFAFGISSIAAGFVPWFYGTGFDRVIMNIYIMSGIILFISLNNVFGTQYLIPLGRQKEYTVSVLFGAFLNFFLNLLLIPLFLSRGAAIATLISEASVTIMQVFFIRKDFSLKEIATGSVKYLSMGLIMFIVIYFESIMMSPSITSTCIEILTGIVVYLALMVISKDSLILTIKDKIKERKSLK